jgi:hypothetical protein
MSQSDYIKYKRVSTQLYLDANNNESPVFTSQNYLDYAQFTLENNTVNLCNTYNLMTPSTSQIVFNMEKQKETTNCPSMLICKNTNRREHRIPLPSVYFTPTPQPLNWYEKKHAKWLKNGCICSLNSINTLRYICNCKTST